MPHKVPDAELEHALRYVVGLGLARDGYVETFHSGTLDRRGERRRVTLVWPDNSTDEWTAGMTLAYYRGARDALTREVVQP